MSTTYRIVFDESLCSGFGECADLAPDAFEFDGRLARIRVAETGDPRVLDAAAACPMGAITIEEVRAA